MKKFLAMLLTLVMIWSLSIPVFAATDGEEDTAIITGLTITVDGVTYTEGQTAVITPDTKSIIIAVSGNNLRNATADNSVHITPGQPGYSDDLTSNYWTVSEDGKTATEDVSDLRVYYKTLTAFEFGFTNDGWETTESSGVSVIYEDGLTEEERAVITGLSLTVDDITYTKGQIAVITPETKSVIITVTGTNLKNATISNIAEFCYGYFDYIVSSRWTVSEDGTTATADMSSLISEVYTNTTAHELVFSNEGTDGGTESGVSVIYVAETEITAPDSSGEEDGKTDGTPQKEEIKDVPDEDETPEEETPEEENDDITSPVTGDNSNLRLQLMGMLIIGLWIAGVSLKKCIGTKRRTIN